MSMPEIKYTYGVESSLPQIENGAMRVTSDTSNLYFDINNNRIKITDILRVSDMTALSNIVSPIPNKFYYVESTNCLYRYVDSAWKPVNSSIEYLKDVSITVPKTGYTATGNTNAPYVINVTALDVRSKDYPTVSMVTDNLALTEDEINLFGLIYAVKTNDKSVDIYVTDIPSVAFNIVLHSIPNRTI